MSEENILEIQFSNSIISRIAKSALSDNSRLSKDACKIINRCAALFSIYIASLSSNVSNREKTMVHDRDVKSILELIYQTDEFLNT